MVVNIEPKTGYASGRESRKGKFQKEVESEYSNRVIKELRKKIPEIKKYNFSDDIIIYMIGARNKTNLNLNDINKTFGLLCKIMDANNFNTLEMTEVLKNKEIFLINKEILNNIFSILHEYKLDVKIFDNIDFLLEIARRKDYEKSLYSNCLFLKARGEQVINFEDIFKTKKISEEKLIKGFPYKSEYKDLLLKKFDRYINVQLANKSIVDDNECEKKLIKKYTKN